MSIRPIPARPTSRRPGQQLIAAAAARIRQPPNPGGLARRRLVINLAKWSLPACALLLLATIALWPEIERMSDSARIAYQRASSVIGGANVASTSTAVPTPSRRQPRSRLAPTASTSRRLRPTSPSPTVPG
jgi:lipopolysaccharide export system protein LptC